MWLRLSSQAGSDTDLSESDTNLPESDTDLPESDRNLPESDRNLSESDTDLPESDTNLPESDTHTVDVSACALCGGVTLRLERRFAMEPVIRRARARVRHLELLEDVDLPADCEVNVEIEIPSVAEPGIVEALRASGGVWSAEAHPALNTQQDAVHVVRGLRAGFGRRL